MPENRPKSTRKPSDGSTYSALTSHASLLPNSISESIEANPIPFQSSIEE